MARDPTIDLPAVTLHPAFTWYCQKCWNVNYEDSCHISTVICEKCEQAHRVDY